MSEALITFFAHLFILILSVILLENLGALIVKFIFNYEIKNRHLSRFINTLLGFSSVSIAFSIINTGGKTIQILFLIAFIFFLVQFKKHRKNSKNISFEFKSFHKEIGAVLMLFSINTLMLLNLKSDFQYLMIDKDLQIYASIAKNLAVTGVENHFPLLYNSTDFVPKQISPYHYFDFWYAAFYIKYLGLNHVLAYWSITIPIVYYLSYLGILSLVSFKHLITFKYRCISFLLLFCGGIYFNLLDGIPYINQSIHQAVNTLSSYQSLYPFLILATTLFLKKQNFIGFIVLLSMPILSFSLLPAVWGGFILYAFYYFLYGENSIISKREIKSLLLYCSVLMLLFSGFYIVAGFNDAITNRSDLLLIYTFKNQSFELFLKKTLVVFGLYPCKILVVYGLWLLLLRKILKRFKNYSLLILFFILSAFGAFWTMSLHHEAGWLVRNIIYPIFNVSIVTLLVYKFNELSKIKKLLTSFLLMYSLFFTMYERAKLVKSEQIYSDEYLVQIKNYFQNRSNQKGAFVYGKEFYSNVFNKGVRFNIPARYLNYIEAVNGIFNIEIDKIEKSTIPYKLNIENRLINESEFYYFVQNQKEIGDFNSYDQSRIHFLSQLEINFLIVGKNETEIHEKLTDRFNLSFTDPYSGETFYANK